jgi:hypothetical protein
MEDDYSLSGFKKGSTGDEIYMHYHQADYLTEALIQSGFSLIDTQRKTYLAADNATVIDLILVAKLN